MKDTAGTLYLFIMIVLAAGLTIGSVLFFEAVATSDLPLWLKYFILK